MSGGRDYVFGYGSLLGHASAASRTQGHECRLRDHRRVWNVAMDNSVELPAYKHYLDERGESRPAVFVTFLNLAPAPGEAVNGMRSKLIA